MIYVRFFASNRFSKKVILICDKEQLKELIHALESADPHYRVLGFVNSDSADNKTNDDIKIKNIDIIMLSNFDRNAGGRETWLYNFLP